MNTKQHNFNAKCRRRSLAELFNQSGSKENGKADVMLPAIDWRETFKQWGYVPK